MYPNILHFTDPNLYKRLRIENDTKKRRDVAHGTGGGKKHNQQPEGIVALPPAKSVCPWPEKPYWMEGYRCCHPRRQRSGRPRGTAFLQQQRGGSVLPRSTKTTCPSWTKRWVLQVIIVEQASSSRSSSTRTSGRPPGRGASQPPRCAVRVELVRHVGYSRDGSVGWECPI